MLPLAERQRDFAAALRDAARPMPEGLVGPDGEPSPKRFAVYRNNVVIGLTETLKDAFPAVHRIVGTEFFQAMARAYVVLEPPRSPILLDYGAGFPDFIGEFEPAAGLPYLADVAHIERAWTESYHAPEASPIDPAALATVPPEQLPQIKPDVLTGNDESFYAGLSPFISHGSGVEPLFPDCPSRRQNSNQSEWNQRAQMTPLPAAVLPPAA